MEKRSEAEIQADRKEEIKENLIAVIIVLVVCIAVGGWLYLQLTRPPVEETERLPVRIGASPTLGSGQAPVQMIIYSDFECPFCSQFAVEEFPKVKQQYVETGKVVVAFKHYPLTQIHPRAQEAAQAAYCAQDRFWEYHDLLYESKALEREDLLSHAQQLGLDPLQFTQCMDDPATAQLVQQERDIGLQYGVKGTPTFFINGRRIVGFRTAEELSAEIEKELQ